MTDGVSRLGRLVSKPLTPLLVAAALCLAVGVFLHPNGYLLMAGIATIITVGVAWPIATVWGVSARLTFPICRATEGEPLRCVLTVRNRLPWPVYGLSLEGAITRRGSEPQQSTTLAFVAELGLRSTHTIEWEWTPTVRGEYPSQPLRLSCRFPFGLVTPSRPVPTIGSVLVRPCTYRVARVADAAGMRGRESSDYHDRPGHGGELIGVRPYRVGDPLRRVHWGQTARYDRLILCEMQAPVRTPDVQVVLDLAPGLPRTNDSDAPDSWREWAIRAAASLLSEYLQAGMVVSAVWGNVVVPSAGGPQHRNDLLDRLARLPTARGLSDWPNLTVLLSQPAVRRFTSGLQIVITAEPAAAASASTEREADRRWVLLRPHGFESFPDSSCASTPRPWLLLDSRDRAVEQLRQPRGSRTLCLPQPTVSSPQGMPKPSRSRRALVEPPSVNRPPPYVSGSSVSPPRMSSPVPPCES